VTVRLRPLRPDEYSAFVDDSRREYAHDLHQNGGLTRDAAEARAERDFAELQADGTRIGRLWFARRELNGRTAMAAFERAAREQRFERLELNVFGGNERARGLYRSLGFTETAVNIAKQLKPDN
jgi:GNAT superfamily N-acetyltransferase